MSEENNHKIQFSLIIQYLNSFVDKLSEFKGQFEKNFNVSRLGEYLNKKFKIDLSNKEIESIVSLILNLQDKFANVLNNHVLEKKIRDNKLYFTLKEKDAKIPIKKFNVKIDKSTKPTTINLKKRQAKTLSDIIYVFKTLNGYKGFDINQQKTYIKNIIEFMDATPYLFETNLENDLTYPTELTLELADTILKYNTTNRALEEIKIENFTIKFE